MTDQPTPRTDAAQIEREEYEDATRECDRIALPERPKDAWELCRELERELAEARKQLADWQVLQATTERDLSAERKDHAATADMLTTLRCELEDERKLSNRLADGQGKLIAHNLNLEKQLAAERALADRLAGHLEQLAWLDGIGESNESEQALAAWKEARHGA